MNTLQVELGDRSYPIHIGEGLLGHRSLLAQALPRRQALVVSNEIVAPLYLQSLLQALPTELQVDTLVLPDGEREKNLQNFSSIMDVLMEKGHNRTSTLIALGGGVIGDLTGFAAACYQRGVAFLQIPTTLLAMVDSSVGGKTAVNHPGGKNMIGAFHQPVAVLADTLTLNTLPDREYAAGMAEVVKYGLIQDAVFLDWLSENAGAIGDRNPPLVTEMIAHCCRCKAMIVAEDETEQGRRAILNLGHTFGHAIEAFDGYRSWLHGEAVAVGMRMALDLSRRCGWISAATEAQFDALSQSFGWPNQVPAGMSGDDFMRLMKLDKKVVDGRLRLVLLDKPGQARVTSDYDPVHLEATLRHFVAVV